MVARKRFPYRAGDVLILWRDADIPLSKNSGLVVRKGDRFTIIAWYKKRCKVRIRRFNGGLYTVTETFIRGNCRRIQKRDA